MKPLTEEWISKAEGDYHTMLRESRAEQFPNHDAVCFHAQQCVEKYLKARMCEAGIRIGKSHDLVAILQMPRSPVRVLTGARDSDKQHEHRSD